jgi:hypothetical protein
VNGISCDGCGAGLLLEEDVRYLVKIEVVAAYDPLEITRKDLAGDPREEMRRLLETMSRMDPKELEDQVYKKFEFDLCGSCQKRYLEGPLTFQEGSGGGGGRFS